eukprot:g5705.t1
MEPKRKHGGPDLGSGTGETAESIKQRGNEHFVAKRYAEAVQCYSRAIDITPANHLLFGNRSAAHGGVGAWSLAAADARTSVDLEPGYTKGFYRLAQALIEMDELAEAASAIEDGLRVDPANREIAALKKRIAVGRKDGKTGGKTATSAAAAAASRKGEGRLDLNRAGLYEDKKAPETTSPESAQPDEVRILKELFYSLRDSVASSGGGGGAGSLGKGGLRHELNGVFSKLIEPEQFRRIALSRLSDEERRRAPTSLLELLRTPIYASALENSLPQVVSRAASVLEAVKRRGKEQGDVMDIATEEALKPQVLQEAFAREVIGVITAVQATERAQAVLDKGQLASPTSVEASWDQLEGATVSDLSQRGKSFSVQDSFLGDEWVSPLLEDSLRFKATGKLHPLDLEREHGEMAWIEPDQLEHGYPVLHELVVNLHALAFELNLKEPGFRLSRPFQGSTMLLRLTERCRVPIRLDSVAGGAQTGHKISAVYFVGRCSTTTQGATHDKTSEGGVSQEYDVSASSGAAAGGQLKLYNIEATAPLAEGLDDSDSGGSGDGSPAAASSQGGESNDDGHKRGNGFGASDESEPEKGPSRQAVVLEPTADRLVLFRSGCVSTETLEVLGHGQEQYAVLFWMHGAKEEVGEAAG